MPKRHVEIAGAGFAGLVAGIALGQRGWSVRIHERNASLRAFGAGIFLWENGLRVLQAIGAYEAVMKNSFEAHCFDDLDREGRLIASKPLPIPQGSRMVTMTRQDLYTPLLQCAQALGIDIWTNSEAIGATRQGELVLASGKHLRADLVIGADGIRSKIRRALNLETDHIVYPIGVFRSLVNRLPMEVETPEWNRYINFWGDRRRVLYVPCNKETLYILLAAIIPDPEALVTPINNDVWSRTFPLLTGVFTRLSNEIYYDQYELVRCKRWSEGRVAIVGDAAHAMPPTIGQGAGSGMMNALALAALLDQRSSVEDALTEWEANERPLTEHTQVVSHQRMAKWGAGENPEEAEWSDDVMRTALHAPAGSL